MADKPTHFAPGNAPGSSLSDLFFVNPFKNLGAFGDAIFNPNPGFQGGLGQATVTNLGVPGTAGAAGSGLLNAENQAAADFFQAEDQGVRDQQLGIFDESILGIQDASRRISEFFQNQRQQVNQNVNVNPFTDELAGQLGAQATDNIARQLQQTRVQNQAASARRGGGSGGSFATQLGGQAINAAALGRQTALTNISASQADTNARANLARQGLLNQLSVQEGVSNAQLEGLAGSLRASSADVLDPGALFDIVGQLHNVQTAEEVTAINDEFMQDIIEAQRAGELPQDILGVITAWANARGFEGVGLLSQSAGNFF